jgi:hypothetical protein
MFQPIYLRWTDCEFFPLPYLNACVFCSNIFCNVFNETLQYKNKLNLRLFTQHCQIIQLHQSTGVSCKTLRGDIWIHQSTYVSCEIYSKFLRSSINWKYMPLRFGFWVASKRPRYIMKNKRDLQVDIKVVSEHYASNTFYNYRNITRF